MATFGNGELYQINYVPNTGIADPTAGAGISTIGITFPTGFTTDKTFGVTLNYNNGITPNYNNFIYKVDYIQEPAQEDTKIWAQTLEKLNNIQKPKTKHEVIKTETRRINL